MESFFHSPFMQRAAAAVWRLAGTPSWTLGYHEHLLIPGQFLAGAGIALTVLGAIGGSKRWRQLGSGLICAGLALIAIHFRNAWLWTLPALAAFALLDSSSEPGTARSWRTTLPVLLLIFAVGVANKTIALDQFPWGISGHAIGHMEDSYNLFTSLKELGSPACDQFHLWGKRLLTYGFTMPHPSVQYIDLLSLPFLGWQFINRRLIAASIGILTLPVLYLVVRNLFGRRAGLAATFLLAVSSWHSVWSRFEGSIQIQNPFHFAVGILLLLWLLDSADRTWVRRYGIALTLGIWTSLIVFLHSSAMTFPLIPGAALTAHAVLGRRRARSFGPTLLAMCVPAAAILWRFHANDWMLETFLGTQFGPPSHSVWLNPGLLLEQLFVRGHDFHMSYNDSQPLLDPLLLVLAPIGLGCAARQLRQRNNALIILAAVTALLPAIFAPEPAPRRMINLLIPLCALGGLAWTRLAKPLGKLAIPITVVVAAGMGQFQMAHLFGSVACYETMMNYQYVRAGQAALAARFSHALLVPNDLVIDAYYTRLDYDAFVPGVDEGIFVTTTAEIPDLLADRTCLPAPPLLILPCSDANLESMQHLPAARITEVTLPPFTPRLPEVIMLVVDFPDTPVWNSGDGQNESLTSAQAAYSGE